MGWANAAGRNHGGESAFNRHRRARTDSVRRREFSPGLGPAWFFHPWRSGCISLLSWERPSLAWGQTKPTEKTDAEIKQAIINE
jgi:hypothetical protein